MIFISFIQIVTTSSSKPTETAVNSTNPATNITFVIKTSNIIPETANSTINLTNSTEINNSTINSISISNKPFVTEVNPTNLFETNSSTYFNSKNLPTNITKKYSNILEAASILLINFHVYTRELN
jgi:hypothetical protein